MPVSAALIAAGTTAATTGANLAFTGNMNRKNRRFADQQRAKQYETELEFWRLNNQYNHPSAQMARLREGGLNPHLVYGNGAIGNSSSAPNSPQQPKWQGEALNIPANVGQNTVGMMDTFQNIQARGAQTDNFREQNTLLKQEQELKRIGILKSLLEYDIQDTTKSAIVEKVLLGLDKTRSEIKNLDVSRLKDSAEITNAQVRTWQDVIRTNQGVLDSTMRRELQKAGLTQTQVRTKGDEINNAIMKIKYELWEDGINPSDPTYLRVLVSAIQKVLEQPISSLLKSKK